VADLKRYLTNPSLIAEGFFRQISSYSVFQNKSEFKVRVLTGPVQYSGPDDISSPSSKWWFKGRITDINMPHEKFLPDPCDESIAADKELVDRLLAMHSTIYAEGKPDCDVGDIISAFIEPGDNNNLYDLQNLKFIKVETKIESELKVDAACFSLSGLFDNDGYDPSSPAQRQFSGDLGDNQAIKYRPSDRGPDDINFIVLHVTIGATGNTAAQACISRMAGQSVTSGGETGEYVTSEFVLTSDFDGYVGEDIRNPTCEEFRDKTGNPLLNAENGIVCNEATGRVEKIVTSSVHYAVDQGGNIVQGVLDKDVAYHAPGYNNNGIGIEICGDITKEGNGEGATGYHKIHTETTVDTLAGLVAELCLKYKVPIQWSEGYMPTSPGLIGHEQASEVKWGPGARLDTGYQKRVANPDTAGTAKYPNGDAIWDWDNFIERVQAKADAQ